MEKKKNEYIDSKLIAYKLRNLKQIVFEVTDRCNLKCKYCSYGEFYNNYDNRQGKNLSPDKAKLFFDYMASYWNNNPPTSTNKYIYVGFYGGEPLLNIDLIKKIVSYANKIDIPNKRFQFNITTNGILLHNYMDFLVKNGVSVLISMDGNEYSQSYRVDHSGNNSFDKIIRNVNLIKKKHPIFFANHVNFNAVLHNKNSVSEVYHFFKNQFNKIPRISELNTLGIKTETHKKFLEMYKNKNESLHNADDYDDLHEELFLESAETNMLANFIHQYSGNVFNTYNDLFIDKRKLKIIPTSTCVPFHKKVFITVNGKILPCERIGHNYSLGEIAEDGVKIDFEEIAKIYNRRFLKFEKQCSKCFNQQGCNTCMFTIPNLDLTPICPGFMNQQKFEDFKKINLNYLRNHPEYYKRIMEKVIITT